GHRRGPRPHRRDAQSTQRPHARRVRAPLARGPGRLRAGLGAHGRDAPRMSATEPTDTGLIDIGGGGMFRSLRVRNFRIWFFGALASSMGAWMQATAMGWVVLTELTDGDAAAMGVAIMFQALPGVLLIPVVVRVVDCLELLKMRV